MHEQFTDKLKLRFSRRSKRNNAIRYIILFDERIRNRFNFFHEGIRT